MARGSMYVCMHACMYMYVCMHARARACVYLQAHKACLYTYVQNVHTHVDAHVHVHIRTHVHMPVYPIHFLDLGKSKTQRKPLCRRRDISLIFSKFDVSRHLWFSFGSLIAAKHVALKQCCCFATVLQNTCCRDEEQRGPKFSRKLRIFRQHRI